MKSPSILRLVEDWAFRSERRKSQYFRQSCGGDLRKEILFGKAFPEVFLLAEATISNTHQASFGLDPMRNRSPFHHVPWQPSSDEHLLLALQKNSTWAEGTLLLS